MIRTLATAFCLTCLSTGVSAAVVDAFDLDTGSSAGTTSNINLVDGKSYTVTVTGTFLLGSNRSRHVADAEYFNLGSAGPVPLDGVGSREIGVGIDGLDVDFGAYNPSNTYTTRIVGSGSAINVFFQDSHYRDNSGTLFVEISSVPLPAGAMLLLSGLAALGIGRKRRN